MLNELAKLLGSKRADRRGAARIRKRYSMTWFKDGAPVPCVGLEISEKGVLFATREAPETRHVDVTIDIGARKVPARLKVARQGALERDGSHWALIAAVFEGIAADDWDAVVRFCRNRAAPVNRAAAELEALAGADDDAYRLLPLRVQQRVVAALIEAGRLAPDSDARNPLLRITSCTQTANGAYRLQVHSRRAAAEEVLQFDSSLTVDESGTVKLNR